MFKIGNVEIQNQIVLAPMASISNSAYRTIIKEMGCGLIYAEMVSDKAIYYGNEKTIDMLYMTDIERPIAQQIFGSDVSSFVQAAKFIYDKMHPDIIDINMGCPVPKIAVRAQAGSALLKDPNKIYEIVSSVVQSVPIPITVKIRSGWDSSHINAVEVARVCERAGASAITVHPRTRSQGYSGKADWNVIRSVKEAISIPVIGNGDIKSCYDAERMLEETGCDAVMIGRGVLGNPWLIRDCVEYLQYRRKPKPVGANEKLEMMRRHFLLLMQTKSEHIAVLEIRSHAAWYLKGVKGSSELKNNIFKVKTAKDFLMLIDTFVGENYES